jgi:hypothetical protein
MRDQSCRDHYISTRSTNSVRQIAFAQLEAILQNASIDNLRQAHKSSSFPDPYRHCALQSPITIPNPPIHKKSENSTYLIQVDNWLPEVVALLVEIPHSDLSKVTWMVFIHVGSVVMLSTSQTTTTWMLAVLAYSSMTGRNVSAATMSPR